MELEALETLLGIRYEQVQGRERVILPLGKWKHVNEGVDNLGTTRLMLASRNGARDCVDFLLRCGAEVNAVDRKGCRAIDYSLTGRRPEVTLLLLEWDSLLPSSMMEDPEETMDALQSDSIRQFFVERDNFHKMLQEGTPELVEEFLKKAEGGQSAPRYWVDSKGHSALYMAGIEGKCDIWALLKASGFACANDNEKDLMEMCEDDGAFHFAIGKYFVPISGCHIQKMVAKSMVYLREGENCGELGEKVEQYFREIDGEEYGSKILQCLQDDDSLEIVFDFSSTDIQSMHPINKGSHVFGLTDLQMDRIYVAAKETEEFDHSDAVSNLMHELMHRALALVFQNGGLPFKKVDSGAELEYQNIIESIVLDKHWKKCDKIIQRAVGDPAVMAHELIVRVPEMIVKYIGQGGEGSEIEDGFSRLRRQAPDLLKFYEEQVAPEIRRYISRNKSANKVARSQVLRYAELLSVHFDENIRIKESAIKAVQTSQHNKLLLMKVSNLKLAVSHLKLSYGEDVTVVDWSRFQVAGDYFSYAVCRGEIKRLALIWDLEGQQPFFCHSSTTCSNWECVARKLDSLVHRAIFVIPKEFNYPLKGDNVDYTWIDLSCITKEWILEKLVDFGGLKMTLRNLIGSIVKPEGVEKEMEKLLGANELSTLINKPVVLVGRALESTLEKRKRELLHCHSECFVPRKLRVGHFELSKEIYQKRTRDAFFISNATENDMVEAGICQVCIWSGNTVPEVIRCFILGERGNSKVEGSELSAILEELRGSSRGKGKNWHFLHFFTLERGKFIHDCSLNWSQVLSSPENIRLEITGSDLLKCGDSRTNEAYIISDVPGSGKSIFMNETAHILKKKQPHCWVGVVDLPLYEGQIKEWRETDMAENQEMAVDLVYELIKAENSTVERKLFDILCHAKERIILFFDAFDEICPNYKQKVTKLIESLLRVTDIKLCVATRTHESLDLENRLSTLAYSFVPFDRSQQVKFLNAEWNASLKTLPHGERTDKVQLIILSLKSHFDLEFDKGISKVIESLESILNLGENSRFKPVSFVNLAENLIASRKFIAHGEGNFSETPLHAWMFASVAFEENFNFPDSLSLPHFYKRFVDIKIKLYSREKAKARECVAGDSKEALFKSTTYDLLKKFSVFFFLKEKIYRLTQHEMPHILRIGVVVERSESMMFVHRTFGEYLFSLWLLEKAKKRKITVVWLQQVLLEGKFEKVRQFIDSLLRSHYKKKLSSDREEWSEWKISSLSRSAIPSTDRFVEALQKCLYTCIVEQHEGILRYVMESCGDIASEVIFNRPSWDVKTLEVPIPQFPGMTCQNAISLCGNCIRNRTMQVYFDQRHLHLQALKILTTLLCLVESLRLTSYLNRLISEDGLWWMGTSESLLWREKQGKEYFGTMFNYLAKHGNAFPETMKKNIFHSGELVTNIAINAFDSLASLSDIVFNDQNFLEYISEEESFFLAWKGVIETCHADEVEGMRRYLEGRQVTGKEMGKFLGRKDRRNRGALFAAFRNICHSSTLPFVWELCLRELDTRECKALLLESFSGVKDPCSTISEAFVEWLQGLFRSGFLNVTEVAHLLLSTNNVGNQCYLLSFANYQSPCAVYMLQDILFMASSGFEEVMWYMEGHCIDLAPLCFRFASWLRIDSLFESTVEAEYARLIDYSAPSQRFVEPIKVDGQGYLVDMFHWNKVRVKAIKLKAFLVLLWRQLRLVERIMGKEKVLSVLMHEWSSVYFLFPEMLVAVGGGENELRKTDGLLLSYFVNVVSGILSKAELAELLFSVDRERKGTAFHWALFQGDSRAFLQLYDCARWAIGEDALWRVHSASSDDMLETVLEALQKKPILFDHV